MGAGMKAAVIFVSEALAEAKLEFSLSDRATESLRTRLESLKCRCPGCSHAAPDEDEDDGLPF